MRICVETSTYQQAIGYNNGNNVRKCTLLSEDQICTVQYSTDLLVHYYPLLRGSCRRTSAEVKLAKMKTQPKMSRHGSGGEAARVTRFARARASGSAWAMRPP